MEQLHFITKLLAIKKTNLQIMDIVNRDTLKKTITKLYYKVISCSDCISLMQKSNLQKPSNIPLSLRKMYLTK